MAVTVGGAGWLLANMAAVKDSIVFFIDGLYIDQYRTGRPLIVELKVVFWRHPYLLTCFMFFSSNAKWQFFCIYIFFYIMITNRTLSLFMI